MNTLEINQPVKAVSTKTLWASRIINGLVILFMLMDSIMKVALNHYHVEGTTNLGWSAGAVQPIGLLLLFCTIMYIIPKTAFIGAVLLTAYLGGAVATMARISEPFYFPLIFGMLVWVGFYFRSERFKSFLIQKPS